MLHGRGRRAGDAGRTVKTLAALCGLSAALAVAPGCRLPSGGGRTWDWDPEKGAIDACGYGPLQRRMLFKQIVDDSDAPDECAILEGAPYKYFLHRCAHTTAKKLRRKADGRADFKRLNRQPDLFRGHVVSRLGVVVEVAEALPKPDYKLEGYKILVAMFVARGGDLYELRMLVPADSTLARTLDDGFHAGRSPVLRVTGFFMKCHLRRTDVPEEPPWRRPLLVTPEPEFINRTVDAKYEMIDAKMYKYLPSHRVEAPGAEKRLVVEVERGPQEEWGEQHPPRLIVDGFSVYDPYKAIKRRAERLRLELPEKQRRHPAAVIVRRRYAPASGIVRAMDALNAAGIHRTAVKDENDTLIPDRAADEFNRRRPPAPPEKR